MTGAVTFAAINAKWFVFERIIGKTEKSASDGLPGWTASPHYRSRNGTIFWSKTAL